MKRSSGRFLFMVSHFTVLILALLVLGGISYQVRTNVTQEMADKQDLVMRQAMKATDAEMEKVIKKAMDISADPYVQWFYYMEEPFSSRELFYIVKLVESLKGFYRDDPLIVDYYVYFERSGRIANANSLYQKEDFYHMVWSYEGMSEQEWEDEILNKNLSGAFLGERIMRRDSAQKELLTYIYPLEKNNPDSNTKVVLLLNKDYILDYLKAGVQQGAVEVTDADGGHILYCQITDAIGGDLPVYTDDEWKIIKLEGEHVLVNGICSETTGWVYTSYVPMKYVMENAAWINRLLITGVALLMLLGSPLCFYWAQRSYVPIQRLIRILFESGYQKIQNENEMDYLAQSLYQVLEKQKDLEEAYQLAVKTYSDLEADVQKSSMWKVFNQNSFSFSAEKKRKLVNYIWTDAKVGGEEILNEVYEENKCQEKPVKVVHQLYLYIVDMVLVALDDSGIDINRIFEGRQGLFDDLLAAVQKEDVLAAVSKVIEHISYMINENKLDTKELVAKRAIEYMKKHYSESGFSLTLMADELRVSPEHLSRVMKSVTGTNYVEMLNQMRLEQAKIYLKTSNLKLEEIAGRVGWGSARYFIRIFKQYEGITPGQYRGAV